MLAVYSATSVTLYIYIYKNNHILYLHLALGSTYIILNKHFNNMHIIEHIEPVHTCGPVRNCTYMWSCEKLDMPMRGVGNALLTYTESINTQ